MTLSPSLQQHVSLGQNSDCLCVLGGGWVGQRETETEREIDSQPVTNAQVK